MLHVYLKNYLWGSYLQEIDNNKLYKELKNVEEYIIKNFSNNTKKFYTGGNNSRLITTDNFNYYNVFTFPLLEIQKLYYGIKSVILPTLQKELYVIQCWVNFFYKGQNIDWHNHWPPEYRTIHGYYCVNVENERSFTEYKFEKFENSIVVESKNGLLVFGKSDGDRHKSSLWNVDIPRVTVAFDIVPLNRLNYSTNYNYNFIPFC